VNMTRRAAIATLGGAVIAPLAGTSAALPSETPVTLNTPTGDISGTLTFPDGISQECSTGCAIAAPLVLIIAGSGPTDRDGNSTLGIKTDSYKLLAQALAARGIGSVRYDKRGIGASAAAATSESDLRFETYVDDAVGWLEMFRATRRSPPRFQRFYVAGHSEGSLIGMIAGARANVAGYISLCGAGRPAYAVIHDQLAPQLPPDQLAQADAIMAKLRSGEQVADVPATPAFAALFHASIQPYLISWFKYDPAVEITKLTCATAIVGGTKDVQVPVAEAQLLFVAAPKAKLTIVDGLSHTLKRVDPAAGVTQQRTYTDPSIPLDRAVVEAVAGLVQH